MPRKKKARQDLNFRFDALIPAKADRRFEREITDLLKRMRTLSHQAAAGDEFKRVWIRKTRVRAHNRRGHWTHRLVSAHSVVNDALRPVRKRR